MKLNTAFITLLLIAGAHGALAREEGAIQNGRRAPSWADRANLDDLVPYTHPPAAWSDRHSDIAMTWIDPEGPGIQRLTAVVGWEGTKITDNLLSWQASEGGRI